MVSNIDINQQDALHKEIDLIEACVNRMAHNSFLLKGWLISLIAVILTLLSKKINVRIVYILIIILLCFWYLDGYFLKLGRLFRKKYEWVIKKRIEGNMEYLYDLNPHNKNMWLDESKKITLFNSIFSQSLIPFYGIILFLLISLGIQLK